MMMATSCGREIQLSRSASHFAVGVLRTLCGSRSRSGTGRRKQTDGAHQARSLGTQIRGGRRDDLEFTKESVGDPSLELALFVSPRPLPEDPSTRPSASV